MKYIAYINTGNESDTNQGEKAMKKIYEWAVRLHDDHVNDSRILTAAGYYIMRATFPLYMRALKNKPSVQNDPDNSELPEWVKWTKWGEDEGNS